MLAVDLQTEMVVFFGYKGNTFSFEKKVYYYKKNQGKYDKTFQKQYLGQQEIFCYYFKIKYFIIRYVSCIILSQYISASLALTGYGSGNKQPSTFCDKKKKKINFTSK